MIKYILEKCSLFIIGFGFALGLGVSGMLDPKKVIGFLDVTGNWDPDLGLVMLGALAVNLPATQLFKRRSQPFWAAQFSLPTATDLEPRLIMGALLFGTGWGLAGICPGPAIVNFAGNAAGLPVFMLTMTLGMALAPLIQKACCPAPVQLTPLT